MAGMNGISNMNPGNSAANLAAAASYATNHPITLSPNSVLGRAANAFATDPSSFLGANNAPVLLLPGQKKPMPADPFSRGAANTTPGNASVIGIEETAKEKATQFNGCATCRERKYVDVSSESDVSFQTAAHIDPAASASVVASHEREHVANAIQKAGKPGVKLVSATVRLITSVCPECGRRYVSGGVTDTLIQYSKNPYSQNAKKISNGLSSGNRMDFAI